MFYKKIILSAVLVTVSYLCALAQQSVVSAGGDATGTGGKAGYTIGQVAYVQAEGSGGSSTPGMQQPFEISTVTAVNDPSVIDLKISAFPNPTMSDLTLNVTGEVSGLSFQLFDMNGSFIKGQKITDEATAISFKDLPAALYVLKVSRNNKEVKVFNIIKN